MRTSAAFGGSGTRSASRNSRRAPESIENGPNVYFAITGEQLHILPQSHAPGARLGGMGSRHVGENAAAEYVAIKSVPFRIVRPIRCFHPPLRVDSQPAALPNANDQTGSMRAAAGRSPSGQTTTQPDALQPGCTYSLSHLTGISAGLELT